MMAFAIMVWNKLVSQKKQGWILSLAHSQAVLDEARRELDRKQLRERRPIMFCNVLECLAKKGGYDKSTQNQSILEFYVRASEVASRSPLPFS